MEWRKGNLELTEQQVRLKRDGLSTQLTTLGQLETIAKDIINQSDIPVYFDLNTEAMMLRIYRGNKELVDHLSEKLGINFIKVPSNKFDGCGYDAWMGSYKSTLILIGR